MSAPVSSPSSCRGLFFKREEKEFMSLQILKPEVIISSFDDKSVSEYIRKMDEIQDAFGPSQPILLNINSFGGSVYGLGMLYEYLQTIPNTIVTYTTSKAMSAGAILLSAGGSDGMRFASPNASIMIHEVQGGVWPDDIKNLENNIESLKKDNEKWMSILGKSMGLKGAKDIRELIKNRSIGHDLVVTSQEAKELGIIDKVCYVKLSPVFGYNIHLADVQQEVKSKKRKKKVEE